MAHVPKSTLTGRQMEGSVSDADRADDFWGTALYDGGIEVALDRENHDDVRRSGYANGALFPSGGFGFRYTVLMIVQWS